VHTWWIECGACLNTQLSSSLQSGGDFHSRTALGMYGYIQDTIDKYDTVPSLYSLYSHCTLTLLIDKYDTA
jgi:hypothetical protein